MSVECFIDSNIFVYLFDQSNASKRHRAVDLVQQALESGTACISYQVIQETINVMTRKLGATAEDARQLLDRVLIPLWQVNPTQALYRRALDLQSSYKFSFYDSLIIAAAHEAGCKTLYSEDLQHGQRIDQLRINNPFIKGRS